MFAWLEYSIILGRSGGILRNPNRKAKGTSQPGKRRKAQKEKTTRRTIILSVSIVVIVAVFAGIAIYRDRVAPFNIVVIEVNEAQVKMRYFLKRVALSGEPALNMLDTLTREQMLKQVAESPSFNITVTSEDIDRFARELAGGEGTNIGEREFREWYRQQLNETRLSDAEYRDLLRISLLSVKMGEYLSRSVATVAEQVFVNMIPVEDITAGNTVKEKYEAGEDFSALAREYSVDPALRETGGKIGWFPQGVLDARLDMLAFRMEIGSISDPILLDEQNIVVVMISEQSAAREIDEQSLAVLKSKVLDDWYREAYKDFEVNFHGFNNGYDSQTDAWVNWQLIRMQQGQHKNEGSG
jgi:parvulin-like peptidyl-prolyl isomerase